MGEVGVAILTVQQRLVRTTLNSASVQEPRSLPVCMHVLGLKSVVTDVSFYSSDSATVADIPQSTETFLRSLFSFDKSIVQIADKVRRCPPDKSKPRRRYLESKYSRSCFHFWGGHIDLSVSILKGI